MKQILLILSIGLLSFKSYSQLLENRTNLQVGYISGIYLGSELFNNLGTNAPSFYSNFRYSFGAQMRGITKLSKHISCGVNISLLSASNWQCQLYNSYLNATSSSIQLAPSFQLNTPFRPHGLFNRLKVYAEVSPTVGLSMTQLNTQLFQIVGVKPGTETKKLNNSILIYGMEASVGCEYYISNSLGTFINVGMQKTIINNPFIIDSNYSLAAINIGLSINLLKIKRYNY